MDLELWHIFLLMLVGVGAGWINVLAGGGSLLNVPVMIFLGLPGPVANGTNRLAIVAQNLAAVVAFRRRGFADFRLSLSLAATASVGAAGGALVGTELDGVWFNRVLAAIMVGVLVIVLAGGTHKPVPTASHDGKPKRVLLGHLLMIGAGAWGGFIQIGVGFIMMPILARAMGFDLVRVNMHKTFINLVFAIVSLAIFASRVEIAWLAGTALLVGNVAGGWLGAHMAVSRGETLIRRVFVAAVLAMVVKLVFFP